MNEWAGMGCLGAILLAPVVTFVVGFLAGRNKLPYRVRIEKNTPPDYEVDM